MEWGKLFSEFNSGTYNNQYMVVDYNKFEPGVQVGAGTLVVVEQIPGLVVYGDQTDQLERGYWSSYNVPFYEIIFNMSGYPAMVEKYGPSQSYQMAPRAMIFRRDQGNIVDFETFKATMRYNDYLNDPYSAHDPGNSICSRFDLEPVNPQAFGCIDSKATSYQLISNLTCHAVGGPTTSNGLPPFQWQDNRMNSSTSHLGQPILFDFNFYVMEPK